MDRHAVSRCTKRTRLHSFNQCGVTSTNSSTTCGSRFRLFFFHLPLHQPSSHVYGSTQVDANTNCSELATRRPLLKTDPNFENLQTVGSQAKNIRLQSSRFSFDIKHSSQMKNMRKLRFKIPNNILKSDSFCFEVTTVSIQVITLVSKLRKFSFESRPRNHILIVLSWAHNV